MRTPLAWDEKLTSASNIVVVFHCAKAEIVLDGLDGFSVSEKQCAVDLLDDGLNIGGAVRGHVQADRLEILPEVPAQT